MRTDRKARALQVSNSNFASADFKLMMIQVPLFERTYVLYCTYIGAHTVADTLAHLRQDRGASDGAKGC